MRVLTLNGGSSSIKCAVFDGEKKIFTAKVDKIGLKTAYCAFRICDTGEEGKTAVTASNYTEALDALSAVLFTHITKESIEAVGHRVVYGIHFTHHVRITPHVLQDLHTTSHFDPDHMPDEIALIQSFMEILPNVHHVACFDTVFHRTISAQAAVVPVPREYAGHGLRKYGFHGLSYAYLLQELAKIAPKYAHGKLIMAHLGNGVSLTAVNDGKSVDTTMGFTPTGGVPMSTRSGDLDPGVFRFLMREEDLTGEELFEVLNKESGLLGISGLSYDMYELLQAEGVNPDAALAISVFCYNVKKQIGAYSAVLDGVDAIVVAGGMGEQSSIIRERVLGNLSVLGVEIDRERNNAHATRISTDTSKVAVFVIPTDEEAIIAQYTRELAVDSMS
jgi:acetate kinase